MSFDFPFMSSVRVVACAIALAPLTALAVDGVVLIDQNKALAGGATPGDTPGFPVTISQPGSYRLSGNLTLPTGMNGIEIQVPNVTIDLNGFSIIGFGTFTSPAPIGIAFTGALPAKGITIKNGTITGPMFALSLGTAFVGFGSTLGAEAVLQDLYLNIGIAGTTTSIYLGARSRVVNVTGGAYSLQIDCPSVVSSSVFNSVAVNFGSPQGTRCTFAHIATEF